MKEETFFGNKLELKVLFFVPEKQAESIDLNESVGVYDDGWIYKYI